MSTTTPVETTAQDAGPKKPTDEFIRALRRRGRQFRRAEAARKAKLQYRVRIERAVLIVARTGSDVAPACRSVGLHSMEAHRVVRALCDVRNIPRQYFWGYPTWQTSAPMPVVVRSRKEVVRRDDDAHHLPREPKPPIVCTCTECGEGFASTRKARYCGVACRVRHWRARQ